MSKGEFVRTKEYCQNISERNKIAWGIPKHKKRRSKNISKARLGGRDRYKLYLKVKELAIRGFTTIRIAQKLDISYPSCRNFARYFQDEELLKILDKNCLKAKSKGGKSQKGRTNYWLRNKTYEEIFGSEEKAQKRKEVTVKWMRTKRNIRRFCQHPSKPQIELFSKVKKKYKGKKVLLEYPVKVSDDMVVWLDIAIPSLKINYELDGEYWHKDREKDVIRDKLLKDLGWQVKRILYSK